MSLSLNAPGGGGNHLDLNNLNYSYSRTLSYDSDFSEHEDLHTPKMGHMRMQTSIGTKIERIRNQTSERRRLLRKRVRDINSCNDFFRWYWSHPVDHFPFVYYAILCLSSFAFIVYFYMDQDSCFVAIGIVALSMCGYSVYRFKQSIALKHQIDHYRSLNLSFRKENMKLEATVNRAHAAIKELRKTKKRIHNANVKNKANLKRFANVEHNMKVIGQETGAKLGDLYGHVIDIRHKWREECFNNERGLLHAVFNRYEHQHESRSSLYGMTQDDFHEFQRMLPKRYANRFDRLGTFHAFAQGKSMIDVHDFADALDVFAEMETDGVDLEVEARPKWHSRNENISTFALKVRRLGSLSEDQSVDVSAHNIQFSGSYGMESPKKQRVTFKSDQD